MPAPHAGHPAPPPLDPAIHLDRDLRAELATKRVGIAGLGGLGSNVAWMLVRSGVRRLVLADFDDVDASNLNRQFYFTDQVGLPKHEALPENLRRIEPGLELEACRVRLSAEDIPLLFGHVDVLVEAFDSAEAKAMIMRAALRQLPETPLVAASGLAGYGPLEQIMVHRMGERLWVIGDMVSDVRQGLPLFASRVTAAAAEQAHLVIRILLGLEG